MRIGGAQGAPPPSQTGRADLPQPAFRSAALDGLAQALAFYSVGSSGGRKRYFLTRFSVALSGLMPPVQVGSEREAAATHTPVCRHRCKSQPSCNPSSTPAQYASPAPAVPARLLAGRSNEDCQWSSP